MGKILIAAIALLLVAGTVQAADAPCAAPVFPVQSTTSESVRRVEQQVRQWRQCQAARTAGQDAAEMAQQDIDVDAAMQKWASATRLYADIHVSRRFSHERLEREQREHLVTRLSPMPAVYGAERK